MNSVTEYLTFTIRQRMGFLNITAQISDILKRAGFQEGLCLVNAMHITASVFINDDEPGLLDDYRRWLEALAPFDPSPETYRHNELKTVLLRPKAISCDSATTWQLYDSPSHRF
jgi:thiamine phosphate synthase YjbQ (UPF0047 family)